MNPHASHFTERWRLAAAEWLDLQDAADFLEGSKNDVLAEIVSRSPGSSHAEKDRNARISDEWGEHRRKIIEASAAARRAKLRVTYAKMQREDHMNGEANRRAESRL